MTTIVYLDSVIQTGKLIRLIIDPTITVVEQVHTRKLLFKNKEYYIYDRVLVRPGVVAIIDKKYIKSDNDHVTTLRTAVDEYLASAHIDYIPERFRSASAYIKYLKEPYHWHFTYSKDFSVITKASYSALARTNKGVIHVEKSEIPAESMIYEIADKIITRCAYSGLSIIYANPDDAVRHIK